MKAADSSVIAHFRDAKKSRIQSVLSEYLQSHQGVALEDVHQHPAMVAAGRVLDPQHTGDTLEGILGGFGDCIEVLTQYLEALIELDFKTAEAKYNEFKDAQCDPGWLEAAGVWFWYYHVRHRKPKFVTLGDDEGVYPLPPGAQPGRVRVGMIADWGTGTQVSGVVLNEVFQQKPDVILHLGDVYYAGTHHEERNHLLRMVQKARSDNDWHVPFYNLPGNHDYYSGGDGFYDFIGQLNSGIEHGATQQASYFALQNGDWQLQGLDTGFNDSDLATISADFTFLRNDEAAWHQARIAAAGQRKIILLSHHQLFSSLATIGKSKGWFNPCLVSTFLDPLEKGAIAAWFWGHEHLLEVYDTPTASPQPSDWPTDWCDDGFCDRPRRPVSLEWPRGRCIGCGGFPVLFDDGKPYQQRDVPVKLVADPADPTRALELGTTRDHEAYNHGYVILDLVGPRADVSYYEVPGDGQPFANQPDKGQFSRLRYTETL